MITAKALLFDFDGVIGDTMVDNYNAWVKAFQEVDLPFDKDQYFRLEGDKVDNIARTVLLQHGRDPSLGSSVAIRKDEIYKETANFRFSRGAPEIVSLLSKSNFPFGLVSGGSRARLINKQTEELLQYFKAIVTADDVTKGKPDPQPYLKGAKLLGIEPSECVVIENAPFGIRSAKNAGMKCVAICSTLTPEDLSLADLILPDLEAFFERLSLTDKCVNIKL